jgi:NAD(P)-dependent dehydrogenase (short-subunit alcohol dehydrogenase family)
MGLLDGQVAAITFGTRSIGRAIAEVFLREGASVVVNGRNAEKGKTAVDEMSASGAGDRVHFIQGDAGNQQDVEGVINGAVEHFGRLDIAVLNAGGVANTCNVVDMSDEEWQYELNLNLNSTFWGMRAALKHLIPQQSGRIISMASVEGKQGKPGIPGYVANKHAIMGLTKACAHEVGTLGITVNAICPGIVLTDMFYESGPITIEALGMPNLDALAAWFYKDSAIQRPITVDEVAAAALFLASPAGAGVTGTSINVDGGSAQY